jgi:hypothetical protein
MKLDRHVDGESLHGLLGLTAVGAEPQSSALATTFRKSARSVMTRLLGLRDWSSTPPRPPFVGTHFRRSLSGDASSAVGRLPWPPPPFQNFSMMKLCNCVISSCRRFSSPRPDHRRLSVASGRGIPAPRANRPMTRWFRGPNGYKPPSFRNSVMMKL